MATIQNPKAIAVLTTALLIVSLFWLMSTQKVNNSLETSLGEEKLKAEAFLSEKLLLEKDLEKLKTQLSGLKGINEQLDNVVKATEAKFIRQESEVNRLRKQNGSIVQLKKQREELLLLQSELENQLVALRASYRELESQNGRLNSTIAQLQEQNELLSQDLNRAVLAAIDHSQVQALKGKKEKLTVKARRTNKLIASFEVPGSLRNISFNVVDPKGNVLTPKQGQIVFHSTASQENAMASIAEDVSASTVQKIQMEYIPKEKLQSGVYAVQILNDNLYVGSMNVKLK